MKSKLKIFRSVLILLFVFASTGIVQAVPRLNPQGGGSPVPTIVSYQGQVTQNGAAYTGPGYFKFAVVNQGGSASYWSNDGTSSGGGTPQNAVNLTVTNGLFNVLLGDTNLPNMTPLSATAFSASDRLLRVWFSSDGAAFSLLSPDRRIAAVPYALQAENANTLNGQFGNDIFPSGAMVLGLPGDDRIAAAGFIPLMPAELKWGAIMAVNPTVLADKLQGRRYYSAVWTGTEMLVWGGYTGDLEFEHTSYNTGARYNPSTDTWQPISTTGAPKARYGHSAVWTGTEMLIFGGVMQGNTTGTLAGRYNPKTDTWSNMMSYDNCCAPDAGAVWTGSRVLVWNGSLSGSGVYNPQTNTWSAISATGAPSSRQKFSAVWTGTELLVWGGFASVPPAFNDGGRYNPTTNTWRPISTVGAPLARKSHLAIWTGSEMLVWGGLGYVPKPEVPGFFNTISLNTGGRYDPVTDRWTPMTDSPYNTIASRAVVWTGKEMIVLRTAGGRDAGGRYDPAKDRWSAVAADGSPSIGESTIALWNGKEVLALDHDYPGGGKLVPLTLYQKP